MKTLSKTTFYRCPRSNERRRQSFHLIKYPYLPCNEAGGSPMPKSSCQLLQSHPPTFPKVESTVVWGEGVQGGGGGGNTHAKKQFPQTRSSGILPATPPLTYHLPTPQDVWSLPCNTLPQPEPMPRPLPLPRSPTGEWLQVGRQFGLAGGLSPSERVRQHLPVHHRGETIASTTSFTGPDALSSLQTRLKAWRFPHFRVGPSSPNLKPCYSLCFWPSCLSSFGKPKGGC